MTHHDATQSPEPNRLLQGGLWSVMSRWVVKFLGLISTIFIVRLLLPQDFGIVMKAMLVFGPLAVWANIGFVESLIRIKEPTKQHYDTAFTANIILGTFIAIFLNVIAPLASLILNEDILKILLPILSLKIFFSGFINPRLQDLRREFQYAKDFQYLVYSKIFHIFCVVIGCFYFRNYYGLIVGQMIGELGAIFVSYYIIRYKPSLSLKYIKDYIDFSVPNMRAGVGDYILMNMDRLLLSRFINNHILGFYNLAYELAEQFTTEVIYPLARAFFPVFADLEHNAEKLKSTYLSGISFLIPLCLGVGIGLSLIAKPLILVYAGEKWLVTAHLLHILAISAAAQSFCLVNASVLGATGRIKIRAKLTNANAIISAIGIFPFAIHGDIMRVIVIKAVISVVFVLINLYVVCRVLDIKLTQMTSFFIRPIIASIGMIAALLNMSIANNYIALFLMVIGGLTTFVAIQFSLWFLVGCPKSIEYDIVKKLNIIKNNNI